MLGYSASYGLNTHGLGIGDHALKQLVCGLEGLEAAELYAVAVAGGQCLLHAELRIVLLVSIVFQQHRVIKLLGLCAQVVAGAEGDHLSGVAVHVTYGCVHHAVVLCKELQAQQHLGSFNDVQFYLSFSPRRDLLEVNFFSSFCSFNNVFKLFLAALGVGGILAHAASRAGVVLSGSLLACGYARCHRCH